MTDLLQLTLQQALRDKGTTVVGGHSRDEDLLEGMQFHETSRHHDERGWLVEAFDMRWSWHELPYPYGYVVSINPGMVKGWALHQNDEDRYFVIRGVMEMVTFDPRPDSATCGKVSRVVLSADRPRIINIPRNVWHADHNIGTSDCVLMNFPTGPYNHAEPDKYRLPLDTDLIPFKFGDGVRGW